MRHRILSLIMMRAAVAMECYPGDYDITGMLDPLRPMVNFTAAYCVSEDQGGGGPPILSWTGARTPLYGSCNDWGSWQDNGGCNQHGNSHYCQCNTKKCSQYGSFGLPLDESADAGAGCYCAMERDPSQPYCYKDTSVCGACGRDYATGYYTYRFGCGCISCITNDADVIATYNSKIALYQWPTGANCNTARWRCGGGTCHACPPGYRCPSPTVAPIPCDAGTYQDQIGASSCKVCKCKEKGFFIPGNRDYETCNATSGAMPLECVKCDRCVDSKGNNLCNIRDESYAYWTNIDPITKEKCRPCDRCKGREYAYFKPGSSVFCVTDDTNSDSPKCAARYNNDRKCELSKPGSESCDKMMKGEMPWRIGYRRMDGKQYTPGGANTDLGYLPYYDACPSITKLGHVWRQPSTARDAMDWTRDCDPVLAQECAVGYYATLGEGDQLAACTPCPLRSTGGGGLLTECTCARGTASYASLKTLFKDVPVYVPNINAPQSCVDCINSVFWEHTRGGARQEALLCIDNNPVKCTEPNKYVTANATIAECGALTHPEFFYNMRQVPLLDRTGCQICPPGTRIFSSTNPYSCKTCDEGDYQDQYGQDACKAKKTSCPRGQYLISDPVTKSDATTDYHCKECDKGCNDGQITVRAHNVSADGSGGDTCDGNKNSYFACYDGWSDGSGPHAPPGYRLAFSDSTNARMQSCGPPPVNHSQWVAYEPAEALGAECYFACSHGVNSAARDIYNIQLKAHVYQNRQELIPFLVIATSPHSPTFKKVQIESVWQYGFPDPEPEHMWGSLLDWDVIGSVPDGNTFLYVDDAPKPQMCMPPDAVYITSCPIGYPTLAWSGLGCALIARGSFIKIRREDTVAYVAISGTQKCIADAPTLEAFQNQAMCGNACLNTRLLASREAMWAEYDAGSDWSIRLLYISSLLQSSSWIKQSTNPYIPITEIITTNQQPTLIKSRSTSISASTTSTVSSRTSTSSTVSSSTSTGSTVSSSSSAVSSSASASTWYSAVSTNASTGLSGYITGYIISTLFSTSPSIASVSSTPQKNSNVATTCSNGTICARGTFRWSTDDHDGATGRRAGHIACVPCGMGKTVCPLFDLYFRSEVCQAGAPQYKEMTIHEVCTSCEPTIAKNGYTADIIDIGTDAYQQWYDARAKEDDQRAGIWNNVRCRYRCPKGYTSNMNSAEYIGGNPCVPCASALQLRCMNVIGTANDRQPAYYTVGDGSTICGADINYAPYMPICNACRDPSRADNELFDFFIDVDNPKKGYDQCLALCKNTMYHTVYIDNMNTKTYTTAPSPKGNLECVPCSAMAEKSCAGQCQDGKFYSPSGNGSTSGDCIQCNTGICPRGQYREVCVNASRDAICVPCPSLPDLTARWIASPIAEGVPVVKANINTLRPYECTIRCANNYAWINLSTGLSPWASNITAMLLLNSSELACVPCTSSIIAGASQIPLFSFWNGSLNANSVAITSTAALRSMQQIAGGCYLCRSGYDVDDSSNVLCELRAGYTSDGQLVSATTTSIYTTIAATEYVSLAGGENIKPVLHGAVSEYERRRRLLSTGDAPPTISVDLTGIDDLQKSIVVLQNMRSRRRPVPSGGDYFATCASASSPGEKRRCLAMRGREWEISKFPSSSRRLLTAVENDACYSGSYKPERGPAPCYYCPEGSSTTAPFYVAATSLAHCVCMPGYTATRATPADFSNDANASDTVAYLRSCVACPVNTYRSPQQLDTAACLQCPPLTESFGAGSAYCYCVDGTYGDDTCTLCEPGFYCNQQGMRTPCPPYSMSPEGARSRSECVCDPRTHYGYLGDDAQECIPRPPALKCDVIVGSASECGCADGWKQVSVDNERIRCSSGCTPGTFAMMRPYSQALLRCEPCPADTYAATGELLLQCTRCPPGKTSRPGSNSSAECRCSAGQSNNTGCVGCDGGHYFWEGACVRCPDGTDSPPNSIGPNACMCPPGSFVTANSCAPCRVGTYSHSLSAVCSRCPRGFTTDKPGATSLLSCRPIT